MAKNSTEGAPKAIPVEDVKKEPTEKERLAAVKNAVKDQIRKDAIEK